MTGFDVVIDFTAPEAVVQNMRACLAAGAKMVIGTTGWYDKLPDMRGLAERKQAALLYGTNFSIGVQVMLQLAAKMGESLKDGYHFSIEETHHASKLDSPSGTALTLAKAVEKAAGLANVPITAHREGDAAGTHILVAKSDADRWSCGTIHSRGADLRRARCARRSGCRRGALDATTSRKSSTKSSG